MVVEPKKRSQRAGGELASGLTSLDSDDSSMARVKLRYQDAWPVC
jgi:hypothetical protein